MVSLYEMHCENLRMIQKAIEIVQRDLRNYISTDKKREVDAYTRLLSHLVNMWSEIRLLKLVHERSVFSDLERDQILSIDNLKERWHEALDKSLRKAYGISPSNPIKTTNISATARFRYEALETIIEQDLLESSQVRNRIAHGQWKYAFNDDYTNLNPDLTLKIQQENIVKLQMRKKLFEGLSQLVHDLALSRPTFERDFDKNFRLVEEQQRNLHKRNYDKYVVNMIAKYQRGKAKKQ